MKDLGGLMKTMQQMQSKVTDAHKKMEKIEAEGRSNQNRDCLRYRKEISVRTFIRQNCFEPYMDSRPIVFLVGDSHSASLRLGLKPVLDSKKINLLGSSVGDCVFRNFLVGQVKDCRDINDKILQEIKVKIEPFSIHHSDFNSQPLEHESLSTTTRPGLPSIRV